MRLSIGDTTPACIQIGHYGEHVVTEHCLLVDDAGRCYSAH